MKTASTSTLAGSRVLRQAEAFTLVELLVVIAIMGILAGFLVGLAPVAGTKMRESRVRAELASIVAQIESYKSKYGFYPPDGLDPVTKRVDPLINPLYYELSGMQVINPLSKEGEFRSVSGTALNSERAKDLFGRDGFVNAAQDRRRLFVTGFRSGQVGTLVDSRTKTKVVDVLIAGAPYPANYPTYPVKQIRRGSFTLDTPTVNPWRYVSSNPTNNPTTFDLWAEIPVRDRTAPGGYSTRIIGNWKNR